MNRVVSVTLGLVLLAAACGGGDDADEASTATTAAGVTSTTAPGGETTTTAPEVSTGGGAVTTAKPTATTAKPTATTKPSSGGVVAASGAPQPTAPGKYTYDLEGSTNKQTLTVSAPTGNDQLARLSTPNAGTSEQLLRYGESDGIKLVKIKQTSPAGNFEFVANPPALAFPNPMALGKSWSWDLTSTDGKTKLHADLKTDRAETVTIGGEQIDTVVVTVDVTLSGGVNGTSKRTLWVSQKYRLPVKQHELTEGKAGTFPFKFDTKGTLQSTTPA